MVFKDIKALESYIRTYFNITNTDVGDKNQLAANVAASLYVVLEHSLNIPEHKLRVILALVAVAYCDGKSEMLYDLLSKAKMN